MSSADATLCIPHPLSYRLCDMLQTFPRWIDDEGRPLFESKSPLDAWPRAMVRVPCKYLDERGASARPMNVSALAAVARHLPFVHAALIAMRYALFAKKRRERLTLVQLSQLLEVGWGMPLFNVFEAEATGRPAPVLSAKLAALFKVCLGFGGALRRLLRGLADNGRDLNSVMSAKSFISYLRRSHSLIGPVEVCAAPLDLIDKVVRTAIGGDGNIGATPAVKLTDLTRATSFARIRHDLMYWIGVHGRPLRAMGGNPAALPWWARTNHMDPGLTWTGKDPADVGRKTKGIEPTNLSSRNHLGRENAKRAQGEIRFDRFERQLRRLLDV